MVRMKNLNFDNAKLWLAVVYIFVSVFHFWPFEDAALWKIFNPVNVVAGAWVVIVGLKVVIGKRKIGFVWPDVSVFCFILVNVFSAAFTDNWVRVAPFVFKLIINLVIGFIVLASSIKNKSDLKFIFKVVVVSAFITVIAPFILGGYGFFDNMHKYISYCSVLAVLGLGYLVSRSKINVKVLFLLMYFQRHLRIIG